MRLDIRKVILSIILLWPVSAYAQEGNVRITNPSYHHRDARWSPVDNLLLFESNMEGKTSIYTIRYNGENIKRLTSLDYNDFYPSWSPDGSQITYLSRRDGKIQIFIYDLVTNKQRQLTTSGFSKGGASWSPDGKQITYSTRLNGSYVNEIFIIDVDGKNERRLTNDNRENTIPVFSADGKNIFYQSLALSNDPRRPDVDIFSYHLPTSKIERITNTKYGSQDPFIYAPNKKLAFYVKGSTLDGLRTYWLDLKTMKMTKFDIKAKNPGHPTWSPDGKFVTIIDYNVKEVSIYDIENSKSINVTDKVKINGN